MSDRVVEVEFETYPPRKNIFRDRIWITRDGDLIPVNEMTDSHLRNILRMVNAKKTWRSAWLPIIKEEIERRKTNPVLPQRRIKIK